MVLFLGCRERERERERERGCVCVLGERRDILTGLVSSSSRSGSLGSAMSSIIQFRVSIVIDTSTRSQFSDNIVRSGAEAGVHVPAAQHQLIAVYYTQWRQSCCVCVCVCDNYY